MAKTKRNCVFVALSHTVGHDLVFERYTNKVVVAIHPSAKKEQAKKQKGKNRKKKDYAQVVLFNPGLKTLYEKHLRRG